MKKKALAAALVLALIAIVVSGSVAFFMAEDEVANTFEMGSVEIEIYENGEATPSDTIAFGKLIPIVNVETPSEDVHYFDKVVDVKNVGENNAYIRVHIGVPTALLSYLHLDMTTTGWSDRGTTDATVEGIAYTIHTYDYQTWVEPEHFTTELLQGVYLGSDVDMEENSAGDLVFILRDSTGAAVDHSGFVAHKKTETGYSTSTVNILVAAEAMQDRGFTDATDALNTGFGEHTNPWQ